MASYHHYGPTNEELKGMLCQVSVAKEKVNEHRTGTYRTESRQEQEIGVSKEYNTNNNTNNNNNTSALPLGDPAGPTRAPSHTASPATVDINTSGSIPSLHCTVREGEEDNNSNMGNTSEPQPTMKAGKTLYSSIGAQVQQMTKTDSEMGEDDMVGASKEYSNNKDPYNNLLREQHRVHPPHSYTTSAGLTSLHQPHGKGEDYSGQMTRSDITTLHEHEYHLHPEQQSYNRMVQPSKSMPSSSSYNQTQKRSQSPVLSKHDTSIALTPINVDDLLPIGVRTYADKMIEIHANLERVVDARDKEIHALKAKITQIEKDYRFNYKLLEQRDQALDDAAAHLDKYTREIKAQESKNHRCEDRLAEQERFFREFRTNAKAREAELEQEVRNIMRKMEDQEVQHEHSLHNRDIQLERERIELREQFNKRLKDEEEAKQAIIDRLEDDSHEKQLIIRKNEIDHQSEIEKLRAERSENQLKLISESEKIITSERNCVVLQEKLEQLERELTDKKYHHSVVVDTMTARIEELDRIRKEAADTAEMAARMERANSAKIAMELLKANTEIAALEEKLIVVRAESQSEAATYAQAMEYAGNETRQEFERRDNDLKYERERNMELKLEISKYEKSTESTRVTLEEKNKENANIKIKLIELERRCTLLATELEASKEKVQEALIENGQKEGIIQRNLMEMQEKARENSRENDSIRRELDHERLKNQTQIKSLKTELSNLERAWHSAEAARQGLQQQLDIINGHDEGPVKVIEALRLHNKDLSEKVLSLENANDAIRKQVQNITAEMRNDPSLKQIEENNVRITEMEETIVSLENENGRLIALVKSRDNEISRYHMNLLTANSEKANVEEKLLSQQQHRWADQVENEKYLNRREIGNSNFADSDFIRHDYNSLSLLDGNENDLSNIINSRGGGSNEGALWMKRLKQLEGVLRRVVKERDILRGDLEESKRVISGIRGEKDSLTDVNNLLRRQLEIAVHENSDIIRKLNINNNKIANDDNINQGRSTSAGDGLNAQRGENGYIHAYNIDTDNNNYTNRPTTGSRRASTAVDDCIKTQAARIDELELNISKMRGVPVHGKWPSPLHLIPGESSRNIRSSSTNMRNTTNRKNNNVSRGMSDVSGALKRKGGSSVRHYGINA